MTPGEFGLDFWDVLFRTNKELVAAGVPRSEATRLRMSLTGHRRPLSRTWGRTIGSWGRTETLDEIAARAGKTRRQAKSYAAKRSLRPSTKRHGRTKAQLAAGLYYDRRRTATESCHRWGVLPVERVLCMAAFQEMLDFHGVRATSALLWTPTELSKRWGKSGVAVHLNHASRSGCDLGIHAEVGESGFRAAHRADERRCVQDLDRLHPARPCL